MPCARDGSAAAQRDLRHSSDMSTIESMPGGYEQGRTDELRVIRGVGRCAVLLIFSFGIWGFAWIYHTTREVSSRVNQPPPSAGLRTFLYAIPIVNYVIWFKSWRDIEDYCHRARSEDFPMVLFWILTFFISIAGVATFPIVQSRLNDAHRAATNGQARDAPMQRADWIALVVGWVFFILWIGLIVLIVSTSDTTTSTDFSH
jgi:hypothetical protein